MEDPFGWVRSLMKETGVAGITHVEPLNGGFSAAHKYLLYTGARSPSYVLKTFGIEKAERRETEFAYLRLHRETGVACPEPVRFGADREHRLCYMLLSNDNSLC